MGAVVFIQQIEFASGGGSDVTPGAMDWDNITPTNVFGEELTNIETVAGIDAPSQFRATWTSTSSNPSAGCWIKNGVRQGMVLSPAYVNVVAGDTLQFVLNSFLTAAPSSGNYDTGTVTVVNLTDGGASIDTFTYTVQYVFAGGS